MSSTSNDRPQMWDELASLPKIYGPDLTSTVYIAPDAVYRAIRANARGPYDQLVKSGMLSRLIEWGVVATELVSIGDQGDVLLRHERVPFVTHPAEWPPAMVHEGARFVATIARHLADDDLMLNDAHLLNVTFKSGKPVYLDFGAIVSVTKPERWIEQFRARVLFPLWLASRGHTRLMSEFLRTEPRGLGFHLAGTRLGRLIPWPMRKVPAIYSKHGWRAALDEILRIIDTIKIESLKSRWSGYNIKFPEEKEPKRDVLINWARETRPRSIHELAGNNATIGEMLARELKVPVISTDNDLPSVEIAHERTRGAGCSLDVGWVDLLFPIPAYGAGACRPGAVQRLRADATLATALVHHLVGNGRVSMSTFVQIVSDYTERFSVIEWVDPTDKHLVKWEQKRGVKLPSDYTLDHFLAACRAHFREVRPLPKTIVEARTLYACSR